jgi:FHA domain/zinc-ribbon domain
MAERFCHRCGHRGQPGSNFCSSCGAGLVPDGGDLTINISADDEHAEGDTTVQISHFADGPGVLIVRRGVEGAEAGETFTLDAAVTVAGRSSDCDIMLDDVTVSRRHAVFVRSASGYVVRDAGSLNGTYLNRKNVAESVLASGDEVQIGKFRLVFLVGE